MLLEDFHTFDPDRNRLTAITLGPNETNMADYVFSSKLLARLFKHHDPPFSVSFKS